MAAKKKTTTPVEANVTDDDPAAFPPQDPSAAEPQADLKPDTEQPVEEKPIDVSKVKEVRVITKGPLGPKLLEPGTITSLPEYVALLKTEKGRKKVEAVT